MNIKKYFLIVTSVLLVFLSVASGILVARFVVSPFHAGEHGDALQPIQQDGIVNILLVGMDKVGYNTDVIMIANINKPAHKVNILSIPRDTRVYVAGANRKINSVYGYAVMNKKKKEELIIRTVSELTSLPIHYYAVINTKAFDEIIDALGGVEYNVTRDYKYDDPYQDLHIDLHKGLQTLNGSQAEGLIRYRHDYPGGDLQRIEVQHQFIGELIRQKLRFQYIAKLPDIYASLTEHVTSNLTVADLGEYAKLCMDIGITNIHSCMMPGAPDYIGGVSYYITDKKALSELISSEFGY